MIITTLITIPTIYSILRWPFFKAPIIIYNTLKQAFILFTVVNLESLSPSNFYRILTWTNILVHVTIFLIILLVIIKLHASNMEFAFFSSPTTLGFSITIFTLWFGGFRTHSIPYFQTKHLFRSIKVKSSLNSWWEISDYEFFDSVSLPSVLDCLVFVLPEHSSS